MHYTRGSVYDFDLNAMPLIIQWRNCTDMECKVGGGKTRLSVFIRSVIAPWYRSDKATYTFSDYETLQPMNQQ